MSGIATTLWLLGLVLMGSAVGKRKPFPKELAEKVLLLSLLLLLMTMGFSTARVPNIDLHWSVLWVSALAGGILPVLGTLITQFLGGLVLAPVPQRGPARLSEGEGNRDATAQPCLACVFRMPLVLMGAASLGFTIGYGTPWFGGVNTDLVLQILLSVLVFIVGYDVGVSERTLLPLFLRWRNLVFPVLTVAGSLLSALAVAPLAGIKLSEALALVSGMGWYSLSSGLIAGMGNPLLGSAAFLANLTREAVSLLLIPALMYLRFPAGAVGSPGAASMDVALSLLQRFGGTEVVPLALIHGVVVTALVPVLVIFWMNVGF